MYQQNESSIISLHDEIDSHFFSIYNCIYFFIKLGNAMKRGLRSAAKMKFDVNI